MQAKYAFLMAIGGVALGAAAMMTSAHAASAKSARQPTPLAVTSLLVVTTNPKG
jgi:hypothetical protein